MLLVLAASCHGYSLSSPPALRHVSHPSALRAQRAVAPTANLFESLGKIAEYNKKYFTTALSSVFDGRSARASHVLFGFKQYDDGGGVADRTFTSPHHRQLVPAQTRLTL